MARVRRDCVRNHYVEKVKHALDFIKTHRDVLSEAERKNLKRLEKGAGNLFRLYVLSTFDCVEPFLREVEAVELTLIGRMTSVEPVVPDEDIVAGIETRSGAAAANSRHEAELPRRQ